ncbi:helix-turn-helix domain-containing protein [Falsibacillus albus]|uniref:DNA-binding protein n=1 Tax=Falsibacillus albus TaxID=2478915 RepID=A0A3L7JWG3_9BACI|nr:helix-turn-helix domain-containing protein [Falsibacillus albus]RLQ94594.1 DNA-binding protein [Falsibacillus albus]
MKQLTYIISAFILGLSLVISAFIFRDAFAHSTDSAASDSMTGSSKAAPELMDEKQLSKYLNVSEKTIETIIRVDDINKAAISSQGAYDKYQFIPYLKIDNHVRFLKSEIDKWLQYRSDAP